MNKKMSLLGLILTFIFGLFGHVSASSPQENVNGKPHRLIVLSDIEADPDDSQSFVRLLLYSNKIDIKGMVATTSCWHKTEVNPKSILRIINAYGKVQPNLLKHEAGFLTEEALAALVKQGLRL